MREEGWRRRDEGGRMKKRTGSVGLYWEQNYGEHWSWSWITPVLAYVNITKLLMSLCLHFWFWLPDHLTVSGPAGFASILIDWVEHNRVCLSGQYRLLFYFLWRHLIASETSFLPKISQMNHFLEPGIAKGQKSWMNVWLTEDWWDGSREGGYHGANAGKVGSGADEGSQAPFHQVAPPVVWSD